MKLYTRTGDEGKTSVIGGRVRKDDSRVEAYGTIDELNSFVGQAAAVALATGQLNELQVELVEIQQELFDCGSDLAFADPEGRTFKMTAEPALRIEGWIDAHTEASPAITRFILPGGSEVSALLHVCRTVCRRAERRVVTLSGELPINGDVLKYINRLSDYFFAAARSANAKLGVSDTEYIRSAEVFRSNDK
ncbi:Cob(I)yrinic acid a,c-diamide adenosyltransferase [Paenibacillus baekrokdamisoli]|uniref:Corrinoid adenosyltransferase n=1 Tax=Paenibacillus baekrokdamisoli TaxID=1712516 RepID=A0A3G9J9B2_9BACL|nr:cob(I)yrinic acid a,c-diamide adenosyltransferase [Paenibacillus baekrokdamisoli]MBB3069491.1 cob(I)alamin adenosyltransferase [Paenibacillus baekrokdamisoli]BBH24935.1 Cob(I)yrinic acid a,c-diamide adenosyltransferase [Paenibacillus baekrokdamisoli]